MNIDDAIRLRERLENEIATLSDDEVLRICGRLGKEVSRRAMKVIRIGEGLGLTIDEAKAWDPVGQAVEDYNESQWPEDQAFIPVLEEMAAANRNKLTGFPRELREANEECAKFAYQWNYAQSLAIKFLFVERGLSTEQLAEALREGEWYVRDILRLEPR